MSAIDEFAEERQLSKRTEALYRSCVRLYERITGLTLDELLEEADNEEEARIRWKKRTLKKRLLDFRKYLYQNYAERTAEKYFSCLKSVYYHFELEIGKLPNFNSKQIDKAHEKRYEDIPNKSEIIDAYYEASNEMKCVITLISSTGISKIDVSNLTVGDFLDASSEWISDRSSDILPQLKELKGKTIFPCFEGTRQKTGSRYTTFCSPEAAEHIVQYLIGREAQIRINYENADDKTELPDKLQESDKLIDISFSHMSYSFRKINDKLDLGKVGKARKFRSHQLRAYHASTLLNAENALTESEVDALQGRKKDKTHRAYFVESTSKLRAKYELAVDELMLFKSINGVDEEAYEELKKENQHFKNEVIKNEKMMEELQKQINQIKNSQRELEALSGL